MTKPKRVGILTSGGDCGSLNAVIWAVVRRARDYDAEAIAKYSAVDIHGTLVRTAIGLGTYVGEIE